MVNISGIEASSSLQREKSLQKEKGFSSLKYFGVALAIAAIAGAIFTICLPASIALMAISGWYLWSAMIIKINQGAEGTCIEKPAHQLHATTMEGNAAVASAALFPFTLFEKYHRAQGDSSDRPILMVNGYLSFGSTWHYQRKKLVDAGLGPIYTMNVGSGKSIATCARQVAEKAEKIKEETGRNDLILIGHSKGGLVSSYYATRLAPQTNTKVTDVVTIGSPLAGTSLAHLGFGDDVREMRPNSKFLKKLQAKMNKHHEIRFFHIASEVDAVVSPSSALPGENPSRQLLLKDIGHLGLVFSSRVAEQISAWLKESPLP